MTRKRPSKSVKKSESLEVRVSFTQKQAFAAYCRSKGITVSEAVRRFIDAELRTQKQRSWIGLERINHMIRLISARPRAALGSAVSLVAALSIGIAAPSSASDGRAVFDAFDTNGDALVSRSEFITGVLIEDATLTMRTGDGDLQPVPTGRLTSAAHVEFERYDVSGDGKISFSEFSGHYVSRMREAFAWMDRDSDGGLTIGELADSLGSAGTPAALELLSDLDRNRDGALSLSEFLEATD